MAEEVCGAGGADGSEGITSASDGGSSSPAESLLGSESSGDAALLDWRHGFAETVRNDPTVQRYKSAEEAAKALISQRKMLSERIALPKGEAGSEEYLKSEQEFQAALRKQLPHLAIPEKAEDYTLTAPEGQEWDEAFSADWKRSLFDAGMNQAQADKVMQAYWQLVTKANNQKAAQAEVSKVEGYKALQAEYGASTQLVQAKARTAFRHLGKGMFNGEGGEDAGAAIEQAILPDGTPLLNVPAVVGALAGIIDRLGEGEFLDSGDYVQGQSTLETYQKEFNDLQEKRMNGTITADEQVRQNRLAERLSRPGNQPSRLGGIPEFHLRGGRPV